MNADATDPTLYYTFLGHQGWHISDGTTSLLLDPILYPAFGTGIVQFPIWPPRRVDTDAMPPVDAVVLTHEHLDHLHFPSLALLGRDTPIFTGVTVPAAVADALAGMGFTVHRRDFTQPIAVGRMQVFLYPAGGQTQFWENRVVQPLVRPIGHTDRDVFIAVDAEPSDLYREQVARGDLRAPHLAVVSNNAQTVPVQALGADRNLLPGQDGPRCRTTGVEILHALLIETLGAVDPLGTGIKHVALCGNGFTTPNSPYGPFLYADHPELAAVANTMQHLFVVHGPRPGDQLQLQSDGEIIRTTVTWVEIDVDAENDGRVRHAAFLADPTPVAPAAISTPIHPDDRDRADALLDRELDRLARDLLATPLGSLAVKVPDYLDGAPLDGHRLVLRLLDPPGEPGTVLSYAWDLTGPWFTRVESTDRDTAMTRYPFGVEVPYQDLVGVFDGRVQVWDVIGSSYQGWYIGGLLDSPVYALFATLGEHQRPDLAERVYARTIAAIPAATGTGRVGETTEALA